MRIISYVILLMGVSSRSVCAQEMYSFYDGIRGLAMGGASVAVVNDETALLSNPAALGKLRDYFITVVDPEIELGSETYEVIGANPMVMTDPQEALAKAKDHLGKRAHARAQLFPSLVVPNFGVGVFTRIQSDAEVDATNTNFTFKYRRDLAAVFGFNFRIWDGIIKLGANVKAVDHTTVDRTDIPVNSTGLTLGSIGKSGVGIGSDAGILLTAPIAWLPSIGAVYRNVGGTTYTVREGLVTQTTLKPDADPATLDAAIAIHPILGKSVRSSWTVEYTDVQDVTEQEDSAKKIHGGFEINFSDALFLRAGWNQRYWTAGMEIAMTNYQFQIASYGEEIGVYPATREDRRYVAKFAIRF